jgi:hypothetical protein
MQLVVCVLMVNKIDKGMVLNLYKLMWELNVEHKNACISTSHAHQNNS